MNYLAAQLVLRSKLTPAQKAVAHVLAFHADNSGESYPSMSTIASEAGLGTKRGAQKIIRQLEDKQIIVGASKAGGRNNPTRYKFSVTSNGIQKDESGAAVSTAKSEPGETVSKTKGEHGDIVSNAKNEQADVVSGGKGEQADPKGCPTVHPNRSKSKATPKSKSKPYPKQEPVSDGPSPSDSSWFKPPTPKPASLHREVRDEILLAYGERNGRTCPWDGKEGKCLERELKKYPNLSMVDWKRCIANKFASSDSKSNPMQAPADFISRLHEYLPGPKNQYGALQTGNGYKPKVQMANPVDTQRALLKARVQ